MNQPNNQPVKEFRAKGGLSFAIWRNDEQQQNGTIRPRYSGRLQKRYRDKEGQWQDSDYLFPEEWPKVELLMRKAFEFVSVTESKEAEEGCPV